MRPATKSCLAILPSLILSCLAGVLAGQDLYLDQDIECPAHGERVSDRIEMRLWVAGDKARVEMIETYGMTAIGPTIVLRLDQKRMWLIFEPSKAYVERPLDAPSKAVEAQAKPEGEDVQIEVKSTGNTKRIGEWACEEHLVAMAGPNPINMQIWASRDVKIDPAVFGKLQLRDVVTPISSAFVMKFEALQKIGFPIRIVANITIGGLTVQTTSIVRRISQGEVAPALFELPGGYRKVEMPTPGVPAAPPGVPAPAPPAPK